MVLIAKLSKIHVHHIFFLLEFKTYEIDESFVHLNYLGPSTEDSPTERTVSVYKVIRAIVKISAFYFSRN